MLKRLLLLLLASLALYVGLRAMVVRTDQSAALPAPAFRRNAVVPALPEEPAAPASARLVVKPADFARLHFETNTVVVPSADANGLPVADAPYYRAAYAAFHLPDASG